MEKRLNVFFLYFRFIVFSIVTIPTGCQNNVQSIIVTIPTGCQNNVQSIIVTIPTGCQKNRKTLTVEYYNSKATGPHRTILLK